MSSWYLPHPEQKHMDQAWEKNPLAKEIVDRLTTTVGVEKQKGEFMAEYTPEQNARYRVHAWVDRLRLEAKIYALWLEHQDELDEQKELMRDHNAEAWHVLNGVLHAKSKGRKTVRIDDLLGVTDE